MATRKNGESFPADISFSVSEDQGRLYFTGIVRDLTETKALQERIATTERLAALGQVVAEITHEIKNPLMLIGGFVRQMSRAIKDEQSLTKLHVIAKEVSRLENLLKDLREFYRPGSTLSTEEMDISGLLQEAYILVKPDCEKKGIRTAFKTLDKPVMVQGDRDKLKQVFLNLLKNSLEAMEEGGHLWVRFRLTGEHVEIILKDDGCGIPEKHQKKIFDPFFTTKKLGTGLGLSISKRIIEDHRGSSLTVRSKKGEGTTLTVKMPVYRPVSK